MIDAFDGIDEKLKRANENIKNLDSEITRFFDEGRYAIIPQDDREAVLKAIAYHQGRIVPLRFAVLAGEIIHQIRSVLDHIVWYFSDPVIREAHQREIEFPIFKTRPVEKKSLARYAGKIQGISDARALALIEMLQPYNASDPENMPLPIIQKMDIIDKHRELIFCIGTGGSRIPSEIGKRVASYQRGDVVQIMPSDLAVELKHHAKLVPQISFRNFGRRKIQPVIPGLIDLFNDVVKIAKAFDDLRE